MPAGAAASEFGVFASNLQLSASSRSFVAISPDYPGTQN
jgi:hypothetical protein